jgi:DNA polymerase I-like protein with 3'-5' exonuclease and polymerase domains
MYAMVMLDEEMVKRNMKSCVIMQVHDSIVADVHPDEKDEYLELIHKFGIIDIMKYVGDWMDPIPLEMDGYFGPSWCSDDAEEKYVLNKDGIIKKGE